MRSTCKKTITVIIAVCLAFAFNNTCFAATGTLNGKWEYNYATRGLGGQYRSSLEFSGKNFVINNFVVYARYEVMRDQGGINFARVTSNSPGVYIDEEPSGYGKKVALVQEKGTYSISGDQIELIYSDGAVEVHSFSRAGNILIIDSDRFTRRY